MGKSRYLITEPNKPHFMTCTVVEWLAVFTRPETVQFILDCWQHQREQVGLKLYGYLIFIVPTLQRGNAATDALAS
jgi:hypothetical protein